MSCDVRGVDAGCGLKLLDLPVILVYTVVIAPTGTAWRKDMSPALGKKLPNSVIQLPMRKCEVGEVLIHEGSTTEKIFFLIDGELLVSKQGVEITVVTTPGAVFGELSHLTGMATSAEVIATKASTVHMADSPRQFLESNPDALYYVAQILAARLAEMNNMLVDNRKQYSNREADLGILDIMVDRIISGHPDFKG